MKPNTLSQSGRTMLEILTVITLVGLLSLLPLEIYNWAIDKYRSNVLKDELLQRSADLRKQIDNHKRNFNLDKWDPYSKIGVPINFIQNDEHENDNIGIQTLYVEERICNMTLDGLDHLEKIRVNDILYTADAESLCKGNDKITLYFNPIPSHSIRKKSLEHCPANTPKNADPDTCACDSEKRYWEEATNECVCWSGIEIDGDCAKSCTTSADCDDNEVCENHICVKYDNTTTMEPIYTATTPETTMPETTTPETTTPETTTPETTTPETTTPETTIPETTTPQMTTMYETTIPETTAIYETTTIVCPPETPHYDTDSHTCVECLTNEDCENQAVCSPDKTCVCQMTGTECLNTEFNPTQCMCCPAETPVYDSVSGLCKTCDEMHPEWAETGSGYDVATKQCWAYCGQQKAGVIMMVDRSQSTRQLYNNRMIADLITEALRKLNIPNGIKTAIYIHDGERTNDTLYIDGARLIMLYGYHIFTDLQYSINKLQRIWNVSSTSFEKALKHVRQKICPSTDDKILVILWTDGLITNASAIEQRRLMSSCRNAKFYYIGLKETSYLIYDKFYPIYSLPEEYADSLNDFIKQEGCITR